MGHQGTNSKANNHTQ